MWVSGSGVPWRLQLLNATSLWQDRIWGLTPSRGGPWHLATPSIMEANKAWAESFKCGRPPDVVWPQPQSLKVLRFPAKPLNSTWRDFKYTCDVPSFLHNWFPESTFSDLCLLKKQSGRDEFVQLWKCEISVSSDRFLIQMGALVLHHTINFQLQNESQLPVEFKKRKQNHGHNWWQSLHHLTSDLTPSARTLGLPQKNKKYPPLVADVRFSWKSGFKNKQRKWCH